MAQDPIPTLLRQFADIMEQKRDSETRNLWTRGRVAEYLGVDLKTLDAERCKPDFPKPFLIGGKNRLLRWRPDEVEEWACSVRGRF